MRTLIAVVLGVACAACSVPRAPGNPHSNLTATSTENTGPWRLLEQRHDGDRIVMRIAAQYPDRAQQIAANAIDQTLDQSPREVVVEVYPEAGTSAPMSARITWTRPDVPGSFVPQPITSTAPGDRLGSPGQAVQVK